MRLLAFVPIKGTLLLILGILIGFFFPLPLEYCFGILLVSFAILGYLFLLKDTKGSRFEIMAGVSVILLGMFSYLQYQPIHYDHHFSKIASTDASQLHIKIRETLKPNAYSQNYIASVLTVDNKKSIGQLLVNQPLDSASKLLTVDQELVVRSHVYDIKPIVNPHQFDFKKYMERNGVYHSLRLSDENFVTLPNPSRTLIGYAQEIRSDIIQKLKKENFGTEQLSIIQALLLGERASISEETYSNYVDAGAVHILAVSGLHVGILLLLIQFLLKPLNNIPHGKKISLLLTVLFLWAFAFIAGLSPSIIRACAMFTFVAYAMYLNRPSNSFNILALSIFFILLVINPNLLFQVGFQMSYAAVFAIVWMYPLLQRWWYPKNKIVRYLWQLLSVSIAAQLGVLPISLFYFHQFPGLFFIANLLIVPFLGVILGMGICIIFLSLLDIVPSQLISVYNGIIGLMNRIVGWIADQEAFVFKSISYDSVQLLLGYLLIGSLIYAFSKTNYKRLMFFLGFLLIFQGYSMYQEYKSDQIKEILLLHQIKNSVLLDRNGKNMHVFTTDITNAKRLIANYSVQERITQTDYLILKNSYVINGTSLQIIDSSGVYLPLNSSSIMLLTASPKINLERLISETNPMEVIADGSNYPSFIESWKATCKKYDIPFHYTGEMGYYAFDIK